MPSEIRMWPPAVYKSLGSGRGDISRRGLPISVPTYLRATEFAKLVAVETGKWGKVIRPPISSRKPRPAMTPLGLPWIAGTTIAAHTRLKK